MDLRRSQSEENPVYYVQYAHARVGLQRAAPVGRGRRQPRQGCGRPVDRATASWRCSVAGRLPRNPGNRRARVSRRYQIAFYLREVAGQFHSYYNAERFLVADEAVKLSRLALVVTIRQVIANGLGLLGVSAPTLMVGKAEAPAAA